MFQIFSCAHQQKLTPHLPIQRSVQLKGWFVAPSKYADCLKRGNRALQVKRDDDEHKIWKIEESETLKSVDSWRLYCGSSLGKLAFINFLHDKIGCCWLAQLKRSTNLHIPLLVSFLNMWVFGAAVGASRNSTLGGKIDCDIFQIKLFMSEHGPFHFSVFRRFYYLRMLYR